MFKRKTLWAAGLLLCVIGAGVIWNFFTQNVVEPSPKRPPVSVAPVTKQADVAPIRVSIPQVAEKAVTSHPSSSRGVADSSVPLVPAKGPAGERKKGAWANVGRATLADAIQSQYWAIAGGDTKAIEKAIILDDFTRSELADLLRRVPENLRNEYSTPESLAAYLMCAETPPEAFLTLKQTPAGDDAAVVVMTRWKGDDRYSSERQVFRRGDDGSWQRVVSGGQVRQWASLLKFGSPFAQANTATK